MTTTPTTSETYAHPPERPGSLPFLELVEELRQLHLVKTGQYGDEADPFANVSASAKCGVEPWRRALCDLSDCVVRLQRYASGQPVDIENAALDAANWALICLHMIRQATRKIDTADSGVNIRSWHCPPEKR